jgi:hypothetical protein
MPETDAPNLREVDSCCTCQFTDCDCSDDDEWIWCGKHNFDINDCIVCICDDYEETCLKRL